jgi:ABC-type branched-subunit amino acid transport system ATPase component
MSAVGAEHLTKRCGRLTAVDDLSFEVPPGQLLAMLGPNGAGNTTTLENPGGRPGPERGHRARPRRRSAPRRPGLAGPRRARAAVDQRRAARARS